MRYLQKQLDAAILDNARLRAQLAALAPDLASPPEWPVLAQAWDDYLSARQYPPTPQAHCRSSSLGDLCLRRLYYERIGAKKNPISVDLAGIFHTGDVHEESTKRDLGLIGYRVDRAQGVLEYCDDAGKLLWRGHPDGILTHPYYPGRSWILDIKSMSSMIWPQLPNDPFDCATYLDHADERPWLVKYVPQVCSYLAAEQQDDIKHNGAVLLFVNKTHSRWKVAHIRLTEARLDWLVERVTTIDRHVEREEPPTYVANPKACELCPYREVTCNPVVIVDAEQVVDPAHPANGFILDGLRKHVAMEAAVKEHDKRDKAIKARFRARGQGRYLVPGVATVTVSKPSTRGSVTVKIRPIPE